MSEEESDIDDDADCLLVKRPAWRSDMVCYDTVIDETRIVYLSYI